MSNYPKNRKPVSKEVRERQSQKWFDIEDYLKGGDVK